MGDTILGNLVWKISGDSRDFDKSVTSTASSLKKLGDTGKKLSLTVTAPLVAAGAAAVKFASDLNESLNAANVVFGESASTITEWGETAATQAGLAKAEFFQTAAVTGSMLKNMGFSLQDSADQTIELTKRAADMASIFNTDVADATTAVAAALRGESEPIRRYGITLSEAAVQAKALQLGLADSQGELSNYAKAQARIALIMEQTNAISGDFVNTSDQLANKTRVTTAQLKNQAAALGQELLPYMLKIVEGASNLIKNFSALDDGTKKNIIAMSLFAAGIGPALMGIEAMGKAVKGLSDGLKFLAANPVVLAIAGVAILTDQLGKVVDKARVEDLKETGKQFENIGASSKTASGNLAAVEDALRLISQQPGLETMAPEETIALLEKIGGKLGLTANDLIEVGLTSDKVTESFKAQLLAAGDMYEQSSKYKTSIEDTIKALGDALDADEGYTKKTIEGKKVAITLTKELTDAEKTQIAGRKQANLEYAEALAIIQDKERLGLLTISEAREQQITAVRRQIDALIELGYAQEEEVGTKGQETLFALIELQNQLTNATRETKDAVIDGENEKKDAYQGTSKEIQKLTELTMDWDAVTKTGVTNILSGFSDIGEAIYEGSLSWNDFGKLGLTALAATLEAIGAQLAALSAVALVNFRFAAAGKAALASAAAFVAAGMTKASAGNFEEGGIVPGNSYTGDKVPINVNSGEEVLTMDDPRHAYNQGTGGTNTSIVIQLDGKVIGSSTVELINNRQYLIKAGSVI